MTIRTLAAALVGAALLGLTAAPAVAQTSTPGAVSSSTDAQATPAKTKLKMPSGATTGAVTVTNSRKADLLQLQAAEPGSANWKKVLGALKPGKQALAKLPQGSGCHVDLRGSFADRQSMDASGIDVCADKTLNLTD